MGEMIVFGDDVIEVNLALTEMKIEVPVDQSGGTLITELLRSAAELFADGDIERISLSMTSEGVVVYLDGEIVDEHKRGETG